MTVFAWPALRSWRLNRTLLQGCQARDRRNTTIARRQFFRGRSPPTRLHNGRVFLLHCPIKTPRWTPVPPVTATGRGRLAQLVERLVYTEDVGSSSLSSPTIP
ncbi:hypothetical protein RHIZ404_210411 [Rhizobium sp. EC-SD404]|nr:hypothetical protein RHIZ404_210411 [Rhizobium sp. EC-SD404]